MLEKEKTLTNLWVGAGFLMQVFGLLIQDDIGIGWVLKLGGGALVLIGCCHYAIGKGYEWPVGFIGVIPIVGLLILIFLPDGCKKADMHPANFEPHPAGTAMWESQLSASEQALFERIRVHAATLFETATRVLVIGGPQGAWSVPLKPSGRASRLSAFEEAKLSQHGEIEGFFLFVRVEHHDEQATRVNVGLFRDGGSQSNAPITIHADGRVEYGESASPRHAGSAK